MGAVSVSRNHEQYRIFNVDKYFLKTHLFPGLFYHFLDKLTLIVKEKLSRRQIFAFVCLFLSKFNI